MTHPLTARRHALILDAIATKPLTCLEIAAVTFTSPPYTHNVLVRMLAEKLIRIGAWQLRGSTYAARYVAGSGANARRPMPLTPTEGQRAYRARIRANPDANDKFLAHQRAKDRIKAATAKPHDWAAALFVGARLAREAANG